MTAPNLPFTPRLPPLVHQAAFLADHGTDAAYGLFHEQGTGKTKSLIDNLVQLVMAGQAADAFVLAPNGVHLNWTLEELPKHWPADAPPYVSFAWSTDKAITKKHAAAFAEFLAAPQGTVRVLCMSYDGMLTDPGKAASWSLLRGERCVYIADESQRFKSPAAKGKHKVRRTEVTLKSSVYAPFRRIASGTPMDTPLDIYSQVRFLDSEFWQRELGLGNFTAFRAYFSTIKMEYGPGGRQYPSITGYRNLDILERVLRKISSRVLKSDVLDLPPKTYKRYFHELTPAQAQAVEGLRSDAMTVLASGEVVTTEMALTLQLRLRQIGAGHITPSAGAESIPFAPNPRGRLVAEVLKDLTRPALCWAAFIPDAVILADASRAAGRRPVIYGQDPDALKLFHAGAADDLIASLSSGLIEGHTLNEADTTIYYSNSPRLITRQQSEDRNHRIGQALPVTYIDLLARGTGDAKRLQRLRTKRTAVGAVLGDDQAETEAWLGATPANSVNPHEVVQQVLEDLDGDDTSAGEYEEMMS